MITPEPTSDITEAAEAAEIAAIPVSLDEATRIIGATWADQANGYTSTAILDGGYSAAVRELRRDLLPPVPGPEC